MTLRALTPQESTEFAGTVLQERYRLEHHVSCGGNGTVYQAADLKFDGRRVAVKLALSVFSEVEFEREARFLGQLNHQGVVKVFDHGVHDGVPFIVMEYLDGESLEAVLTRYQRRLPIELVTKFVDEIGAALRSAHGKNVIHRDLKPQNVLLVDTEDRDDSGCPIQRFVLVDFGIASKIDAKATMLNQTMAGLGTPEYRSPEQLNRLDVSPSTDIYTFGVVLYELLTGRVPFPVGGNSHADLGRLYIAIEQKSAPPFSEAAPDRDFSPSLEELVLQCLEKEPSRRPQTIGEVRRRYLDIVAGSQDGRTARPDSLGTMRPSDLSAIRNAARGPDSSDTFPRPQTDWPRQPRRRGLWIGLLVVPALVVIAWIIAAPFSARLAHSNAIWQPAGFDARGKEEAFVKSGSYTLPSQLIRRVSGLSQDQEVVFVRMEMPKAHGTGVDYLYILRDKVWYALYEQFIEAAERNAESIGLKKWGLTLDEIKRPLRERDRVFVTKSTELTDRERWPVTNLSPNVAGCFAAWLVPDGRLPTSDEWWSAAGYHKLRETRPGPFRGEGKRVAVGNDSPVPVGASHDDNDDEPFGCNDLAGNGYEWTSSADTVVNDQQQLAHTTPLSMPISKDQSVVYVGQNFEAKEPLKFADAAGIPQVKSEADYTIGFRVVFEPEGSR